jgi:hypothetical protein
MYLLVCFYLFKEYNKHYLCNVDKFIINLGILKHDIKLVIVV